MGTPVTKLPQRIIFTALLALWLFPPINAQQRSSAASMQSFQIPSHGAFLNAFVYVAAGEGPHPAVVLLHGFPGNERNLDLAQEIRTAGWDVLYFDYRGSWGSPGDFSFSHGVEDTAAAVDFLRSAPMAKILRLDPSRIVLIGHSMGGFMAVQAAAADRGIIGIGLISAADMGGRVPQTLPPGQEQAKIQALSAAYQREGMEPLSGCTPEGLAHEAWPMQRNGASWPKVDALKSRPLLVVTSDDAYAAGDEAFAGALRRAGERAGWRHSTCIPITLIPTNAAALTGAVLRWLASVISPAGPR